MNRISMSGIILALALLFTLFFPPSVWAENKDGLQAGAFAAAKDSSPSKNTPAIVMIHNRPIAIFYAPLYGNTPQKRAEITEDRINKALSEKDLGKVTSKQIPLGTVISIGKKEVLLLTPGDTDPSLGETRGEIVDRAINNLTLAVEEVKEWRDPRHLFIAALSSFGVTLFYVALLWGLSRSSRWAETRFRKRKKKWMEQVEIKGFSLQELIAQITHYLWRFITWTLGLFATYSWLVFCLKRFPYTRAWGEHLGGYLFDIVKAMALGVIKALPSLFTVFIIILCTRILTKLTKKLFKAVEEDRVRFMQMDPEVAKPTSRIIILLIWLFALIMAYPYLPGSGTAAFKGVSIFAGLIASLGTTSIVNQAAGGLVLMYSRAFRTGDFIKVGENEGIVQSLGILSTKIRTPAREEITIPNAVLVGNTTINYTRPGEKRGAMIQTSVSIGYTTPWRKVQSLLLTASRKTRGVLTDPAPFVRQVRLGDFYVEYKLIASVSNPEARSETLSELLGNIQDVFNEQGEQIMSPHYVADTPQKQVIPKSKWYDLPAAHPREEA